MLIDVLERLATSTGLSPLKQRETLLKLLNSGAKEMYDRLDCNKLNWENTLRVPVNRIVSLPNYLGEIKGIRSTISGTILNLNSMSQPRYTSQTWTYRWKNWRDLGESAIQQAPSVIGPLAVTGAVQSTPVTIIISGQTADAYRIEEKLVLDEPIKKTTNLFQNIYSISCLAVRDTDLTISDANGIILAVLPNTDKKTRYKMIDVSQFPGLLDVSDNVNGNTSLIDVLYKVPLRKLTEDSDSFPAGDDYDNAWYHFSLWLFYLPMQNKASEIGQQFQLAITSMQSVKDGTERSIEKKITFGRNKFYDLFKRRFYYGSSTHPHYYVE